MILKLFMEEDDTHVREYQDWCMTYGVAFEIVNDLKSNHYYDVFVTPSAVLTTDDTESPIFTWRGRYPTTDELDEFIESNGDDLHLDSIVSAIKTTIYTLSEKDRKDLYVGHATIHSPNKRGIHMKKAFWKYFGAMMSEKKNGEAAVSYTRTLGLVTYFLWFGLVIASSLSPEHVTIPGTLEYTLWGLIGLKGAKDVAQALKGNKGG